MKVAAECSVPQQTECAGKPEAESLRGRKARHPGIRALRALPARFPRRYRPRCALSRLPPRSRPFPEGPPGRGLYRRGLPEAAVAAERRAPRGRGLGRPLLGRRILPALGPTSLANARRRRGRGVWDRGRARPQAPRAASRPRRGNGCEPRPPPAYRLREGPEHVGSGARNAPVLAPDLGPSDRTEGREAPLHVGTCARPRVRPA